MIVLGWVKLMPFVVGTIHLLGDQRVFGPEKYRTAFYHGWMVDHPQLDYTSKEAH
jgi:hypothetical protein